MSFGSRMHSTRGAVCAAVPCQALASTAAFVRPTPTTPELSRARGCKPGRGGSHVARGRKATHWREFEEARALAHSLKLGKRQEWYAWCKDGGERPPDVPTNPDKAYREKGWVSWRDWLGYGAGQRARKSAGDGFRPFEEAREFARSLKLEDREAWTEWSSSGARPYDIPSNPHGVYCDDGWLSYADWLGYGSGKEGRTMSSRMREYRAARAWVRALNLESTAQWFAFCASGDKPDDIPSNPNRVYRDKGWASYPDWLGYGPPQGEEEEGEEKEEKEEVELISNGKAARNE